MQTGQEEDSAIALVHQWIEQCVIDLSLCPFAGAPYRAGKVRIATCSKDSESRYFRLVESELERLLDEPTGPETTLIIGLQVLDDFLDFNDFLASAEALLTVDDRDSHIQIASFHPEYRFAGVDAKDVGNYTNRSPFPIVQWLRTESVTKAVSATDTSLIPDNNIATLKAMQPARLRSLFPWVDQAVGGSGDG